MPTSNHVNTQTRAAYLELLTPPRAFPFCDDKIPADVVGSINSERKSSPDDEELIHLEASRCEHEGFSPFVTVKSVVDADLQTHIDESIEVWEMTDGRCEKNKLFIYDYFGGRATSAGYGTKQGGHEEPMQTDTHCRCCLDILHESNRCNYCSRLSCLPTCTLRCESCCENFCKFCTTLNYDDEFE